jgi:hypothetical protein
MISIAVAGGLHYMTLLTVSGVQSIAKSLEERRMRRRRRAMSTIRRLQIAQLQRNDDGLGGEDSDDDDEEATAAAVTAALEAGMVAAAREITAGAHDHHHGSVTINVDANGIPERRSLTRRNSEPDLRAASRISFNHIAASMTGPVTPIAPLTKVGVRTSLIASSTSTDPLAIAGQVGDDTLHAATGAAIAAARAQLSRSASMRQPSHHGHDASGSNDAHRYQPHLPTEPWIPSIAANDSRNPFHPSIAAENEAAAAAATDDTPNPFH